MTVPFGPDLALATRIMKPRFSVIICTYNRLNYLTGLLDSWLAVEEPAGGYELIIADDGSNESPEAIVRSYQDKLPIRFFRFPHAGLSPTRQAALQAASGDYALFTDDDCRPCRDLLISYQRAVEEFPDRAFGGPVVNLLTDNIYSEATQAIMTYIVGAWNSTPSGPQFFTGSNLLFPREKLLQIGAFDTSWSGAGEERDACRRWAENGLKMSNVPAACVGHMHHLTLKGFLRQHHHYGRGSWWCENRRRKPDAGAPGWSGIFFYIKLLLYPFGRYPLKKSLGICCLVMCAQLATFCGSLQSRFLHRRGRK
jgi:glycosyltransferase involved in cell wall biosynthesis